MNIAIVPAGYDQPGLARHPRVDGRLTKTHAVGAILRRRRNAANHITGIDIFERQLCLALAKLILNLALEKDTDVSKTLIS